MYVSFEAGGFLQINNCVLLSFEREYETLQNTLNQKDHRCRELETKRRQLESAHQEEIEALEQQQKERFAQLKNELQQTIDEMDDRLAVRKPYLIMKSSLLSTKVLLEKLTRRSEHNLTLLYT